MMVALSGRAADTTLVGEASSGTVETVIAGVPRNWPPQYSQGENGEPTGFAIEVMDRVAEIAGVAVEYRTFPNFAEVASALRAGRIDLVPNSGITPDRAERFLFTDPVEAFSVSIFVRSKTLTVRSADDLRAVPVGVVQNNVGEKLMAARDDVVPIVFDDAKEALFELLSGNIDAVVFPRSVFEALARKAEVSERIKTVGPPLAEIKRAIRITAERPDLHARLNRAVKAFITTSEYRQIYSKWYGDTEVFWTVERVIWTMGGLLVLVVGLLVWLRHRDNLRMITALRRSEARYRDVAELASDWIWEMDADLRFTTLSDRFTEITGIPVRSLVGKTRSDIAQRTSDHQSWTDHLATLQARKPFRNFTYRITDAHGETIYVTVNGKPIFDQNMRFAGYRGTGTDMTAQMEAQAVRDAALRAAEEANQAKSQFLATMSHELRTPLNAILGFSEVLHHRRLGTATDGKYQEYAGDIFNSAEHLLDLVNDLLDVSAIESGRADLMIQDLALQPVISDCLRSVENQARAKGIQLAMEVADGLPPLPADRRAIKQVLINLLSNAQKFTPAGGNVSVRADAVEDCVRIAVIDTGAGMATDPRDTPARVFGKEARQQAGAVVGTSPFEADKGWGLGLSIATSLVEMHGGRLEIDSGVGDGTTVSVFLPLKAAA